MKRTVFFLVGLLVMAAVPLVAQDGQLKIAKLGKCPLESGAVIEDCVIGYRTFGSLDAARDNAILMPSWLNGRSEDLSGLFGSMPSNFRLVDTSMFFGIAVDSFGDGVSSSPSNSKSQHGTAFPIFTTRDMVEAEYRLASEVLGLKHLHAVMGLSMGGLQTFMWAVCHPDFFTFAVPIIGSPRATPYDLETKQIVVEAIQSDPDYNNGNYTKQPALKLANLYGAQAVTTPDQMNADISRAGFEKFVLRTESPQRQDANDRVWQLRAIMRHDAIRDKTIAEVAKASPVHFIIIVNANDHMVVPQPALEWAAAANAEKYVSHGACGHLIMNCDAAVIAPMVQHFLAAKP
jgi:homoserine O-acetyltransferase/O-succinyltransferase